MRPVTSGSGDNSPISMESAFDRCLEYSYPLVSFSRTCAKFVTGNGFGVMSCKLNWIVGVS